MLRPAQAFALILALSVLIFAAIECVGELLPAPPLARTAATMLAGFGAGWMIARRTRW
jgi:hypothetical protein